MLNSNASKLSSNIGKPLLWFRFCTAATITDVPSQRSLNSLASKGVCRTGTALPRLASGDQRKLDVYILSIVLHLPFMMSISIRILKLILPVTSTTITQKKTRFG
jgi:hypothetical protein